MKKQLSNLKKLMKQSKLEEKEITEFAIDLGRKIKIKTKKTPVQMKREAEEVFG